MEITLASAICIELWDEVKELSRIVLRYSSDTIAIGKAIKILQK
jgi:translation elongation factor EF-1alpha